MARPESSRKDDEPNGHRREILPLKRVLLRAMPELAGELKGVVNALDPWTRDLGEHYSIAWKPRRGAEGDPGLQAVAATGPGPPTSIRALDLAAATVYNG